MDTPLLSVYIGVALAMLGLWKEDRDIRRLLDLVLSCETREHSLYRTGPLLGRVRDNNGVPKSTRLSR